MGYEEGMGSERPRRVNRAGHTVVDSVTGFPRKRRNITYGGIATLLVVGAIASNESRRDLAVEGTANVAEAGIGGAAEIVKVVPRAGQEAGQRTGITGVGVDIEEGVETNSSGGDVTSGGGDQRNTDSESGLVDENQSGESTGVALSPNNNLFPLLQACGYSLDESTFQDSYSRIAQANDTLDPSATWTNVAFTEDRYNCGN